MHVDSEVLIYMSPCDVWIIVMNNIWAVIYSTCHHFSFFPVLCSPPPLLIFQCAEIIMLSLCSGSTSQNLSPLNQTLPLTEGVFCCTLCFFLNCCHKVYEFYFVSVTQKHFFLVLKKNPVSRNRILMRSKTFPWSFMFVSPELIRVVPTLMLYDM